MTGRALSNALLAMLPGAVVKRTSQRDWHSASFSGVRTIIELGLGCEQRGEVASFSATLPDHEFALPCQLVADIAVSGQRDVSGGLLLTVEALLLADDN